MTSFEEDLRRADARRDAQRDADARVVSGADTLAALHDGRLSDADRGASDGDQAASDADQALADRDRTDEALYRAKPVREG